MPRYRVFDPSTRSVFWAVGCLIVAIVCEVASPAQSLGQDDGPAPAIPSVDVDPEKQADLYRELEQLTPLLEAQSKVIKTVAKLIKPTVVHIEADVPSGSSSSRVRGPQVEENGSGVIVQINGKHYVLTNWHLVKRSRPQGIRINLSDGRQIRPDKIWGHEETDIAVMAVSEPQLLAARIGDSDQSEVGDFVLVVGSPFGLTKSVTFGIISAKGRRDLQLGEAKVSLQDFIQTDAVIHPGNSGGPLINMRGELIGINTAIASNSRDGVGIGFTIPVNMFMHFSRQLIEHGKVTRAFLGVVLDSHFSPASAAKVGLPRLIGTRITGITPGTPAAEAGLKVGDVILQFNETPVENDSHLIKLVGLTGLDADIALIVFRDGKAITITTKVGNRESFQTNR